MAEVAVAEVPLTLAEVELLAVADAVFNQIK
jgi:hypothetical protein